VKDADKFEAIECIFMQYPFCGYHRVHQNCLTRVRRLLKILGGSRKVGNVYVQTTDSKHSLTVESFLKPLPEAAAFLQESTDLSEVLEQFSIAA